MKANPAAIIVGERMRALSEPNVARIAESFKEVGQLQAISVVQRGSEQHLVAGWHRLEAARRLNWTQIDIEVHPDADIDTLKLRQIDENLARGELTPVEVAVHQRERKRLAEAIGMARPRGRPSKSAQKEHIDSYAKTTANERSRSRQTIQREVARGDALAALGADAAALAHSTLDQADQLDSLVALTMSREATAESKELAQQLVQEAVKGGKPNAKTVARQFKMKVRDRAQAAQVAAESARLGSKVYGILLVDPPWPFDTWSEAGKGRAAENHYRTESLDAIRAIPVAKAAAQNCLLFLWSTTSQKANAIEIGEAWGFTYDSTLYWNKVDFGLGYWARDQVEELLIMIKGNPVAPAPGENRPNLWTIKKGPHSAKPDAFRDWIAHTWPETPKLEMFARSAAPGWENWGIEAPSVIEAADTAGPARESRE